MRLRPWLIMLSLLIACLGAWGCGKGQPTSPPRPSASPTPTPTPTPSPAGPESLFLEVLEPLDETVVHVPDVQVIGVTLPEAIVSVNGELAEVDDSGSFSTRVSLEEGPNLIQVVASDLEGNEVNVLRSVIYVP